MQDVALDPLLKRRRPGWILGVTQVRCGTGRAMTLCLDNRKYKGHSLCKGPEVTVSVAWTQAVLSPPLRWEQGWQAGLGCIWFGLACVVCGEPWGGVESSGRQLVWADHAGPGRERSRLRKQALEVCD